MLFRHLYTVINHYPAHTLHDSITNISEILFFPELPVANADDFIANLSRSIYQRKDSKLPSLEPSYTTEGVRMKI